MKTMNEKQPANWHDLKGQLITGITVDTELDELTIHTFKFKLTCHHVQDCCETVGLVRIEGDFLSLHGAEILHAEDDAGAQDPSWYKEDYDESHTWTKLSLYTSKGDVHFWFLGQSNGYYGEDISFYKQ